MPQVKASKLKTLPFPDPVGHPETNAVAAVVALAGRMLGLHKSLSAAKTPHAQDSARRQIEAVDARIDKLVYRLYALTDAEIATVESATAPAAAP